MLFRSDSNLCSHSVLSALPLSRGGNRPPPHTEENGGKGCRESSGEWSDGVSEGWGDATGGNRGIGEKQTPAWDLPFVPTPWEQGAAAFASVDDLHVMPLEDSRFLPPGLRAGCGNAWIWRLLGNGRTQTCNPGNRSPAQTMRLRDRRPQNGRMILAIVLMQPWMVSVFII